MPLSNFEWSVRFLFRDQYKVMWVTCQAQLESANFTSGVYNKYNNCFGLGQRSDGSLRKLSIGTSTGGLSTEPKFAIYANVADCVYSYYYMLYEEIKPLGVAVDSVPNTPFVDWSEAVQYYLASCIGTYKAYNYFGASISGYSAGIAVYGKKYHSGRFFYRACNFLTVVFWLYLFWNIVQSIKLFRKGKDYVKNKIGGNKSKPEYVNKSYAAAKAAYRG